MRTWRLSIVRAVISMPLAIVLSASSVSWATIVLHDDFNDGLLDQNKWWANTNSADSAVIERSPEGDLASKNRGFLNSNGEWKPGTTEVPVLRVTGRFLLPKPRRRARRHRTDMHKVEWLNADRRWCRLWPLQRLRRVRSKPPASRTFWIRDVVRPARRT